MIPKKKSIIRPAAQEDKQPLDYLIRSGKEVHKHLDWRSPLDRIEELPFLIMERDKRIIGALACPPDPPKIAWIQLFLTTGESSTKSVWNLLLEEALSILKSTSTDNIMVIPTLPWFTGLLLGSGFIEVSRVLSLNLNYQNIDIKSYPSKIKIRPMAINDLPELEVIDLKSFGLVWHNTRRSLKSALGQSLVATVAEISGKLIGYQISTISDRSIHLARLAVNPENQNSGVGTALLTDLISKIQESEGKILSVNTQYDNSLSLKLYQKFGFQRTKEHFPVFGLEL